MLHLYRGLLNNIRPLLPPFQHQIGSRTSGTSILYETERRNPATASRTRDCRIILDSSLHTMHTADLPTPNFVIVTIFADDTSAVSSKPTLSQRRKKYESAYTSCYVASQTEGPFNEAKSTHVTLPMKQLPFRFVEPETSTAGNLCKIRRTERRSPILWEGTSTQRSNRPS